MLRFKRQIQVILCILFSLSILAPMEARAQENRGTTHDTLKKESEEKSPVTESSQAKETRQEGVKQRAETILIEKERPFIGVLKLSFPGHMGPCKSSLLVSEQFRLDKRFRDSSAIDSYKRLAFSRGSFMDGTGGEFFSCPAFSQDKHRYIRWRHLADQRKGFSHGLTVSQKLLGFFNGSQASLTKNPLFEVAANLS